MTRTPKKSETLEIRIPHETKQALMARSRAEGKPASEVVRGFIDAYLAEAACSTQPASGLTAWDRNMTRLRLYARPSMALFATLVAVGGIGLAVSPATALPDLQAAFTEADVDGNGVLSPDEFGGTLSRTFRIGPAGAAEPPALPKADKAQPGLMFMMRAAPDAGGPRDRAGQLTASCRLGRSVPKAIVLMPSLPSTATPTAGCHVKSSWRRGSRVEAPWPHAWNACIPVRSAATAEIRSW